jgi:hypothetical protein
MTKYYIAMIMNIRFVSGLNKEENNEFRHKSSFFNAQTAFIDEYVQ